MKNNRGFTLVELLAVIAILAIIIIMALLGVTTILNYSKKNMFLNEVRQVYRSAQKTWMNDTITEAKEIVYSRTKEKKCDNELPLSVRNEIEYFIKLNASGNVIEYYITDSVYGFKYTGEGLKETEIKKVFRMSKLKKEEMFKIQCDKVSYPILEENTPPPGSDFLMKNSFHLGYSESNGTEVFLRTKTAKKKIEKVRFTNSLEGHKKNNRDCFDAGAGSKGTILSWVEDKDRNGLYEVTIGSEGQIFVKSTYALFAYMFNLKTIEGIENLNTYNTTNMGYMFLQATSLKTLDLSSLKTDNVTNMEEMFRGCDALTSLNISNFNTSKVNNMTNMFMELHNLSALDVSSFDTSKVTNMTGMFAGNFRLKSLDLSNFNTSKVTNMHYMFSGDYSLTSLNLSSFDTSNVTNMSTMFQSVGLKTLDLSNFRTPKVKNYQTMFNGAFNLEVLDISGFDTTNATAFDDMFRSCGRLKTIYVGDKFTTANKKSENLVRNMFWQDYKLVGGMGTVFNSTKINDEYAHIDGGPSNPGYFTAK